MAKLTGWSPKRRGHQSPTPQQRYTEQQLNEPLEFFSFEYFEKTSQVQTTRGELLRRFYRQNPLDDGCKAWLACQLDPIQFTPAGEHIWFFMHYADYHVRIEKSYFGTTKVHRVRLFYRTDQKDLLWLASAQIGPVNFYDQTAVIYEYMTVLGQKKFYQSERDSRKVVDI